MDYTIKINNNLIDTTYGLTIVKRLDEELDTASFILPITEDPAPLPMYEKVEINDGLSTTYWLIMDDVVEPISFNPIRYSHTINLIEYTKKLEYYFLTAATFTQPDDGSVRYTIFDVVDRLRKIVVAELKNTTKNYPYEINEATETYLSNFKAPEMFFNNITLLEALKQTLMYVGIVPRLDFIDNQDTLMLDFIAEEKDLVNLNELWIGKSATQDALFYSTTLISEADNIISTDLQTNAIYFPSDVAWAPLTAETGAGIVNNESSVMNVKKGIYNLLELKVLARVRFRNENGLADTAEVEADLTDYVFVKEAYNLLSANWDYISDTKTQQNSIWYEQNSNVIQGLTTDWSTFFTPRRRSLENAILTEYRKINNLTPLQATDLTIDNDFYDCVFRAKFIPIEVDRHLEMERSNVDEIKKITKTFFSQNDRLISLDNYSSRMKKTIDRLGEPVITISLMHPDINDAWEVGDYTNNDYRLVAAELQYEKDYLLANYQFTKHFPNINRFIGVDRSLQPFELPTGFKVLNRSISYKDYLTLSTANGIDTNNSIITNEGAQQILKTFDNAYSAIPSESALIINTFEPGTDEQKGRIQSPSIFNGVENAFLFSFGFDDNIVAGYRLVPLEDSNKAGFIQAGVPYTEFGGVLDETAFEIKAKRINSAPANFAEAQGEANTLPIVNWFDSEATYARITSANPLEIYKDPAEILSFNYQLNVFGETNQIIIGKSFTRLNKLIHSLDELLFLYTTPERYTQYDNEKILTSNQDTLNTTISSTAPYSITINNALPAGTNSYAIATATGELLLAVNRVDGVLPTTLYFNFSHVRPGTEIL